MITLIENGNLLTSSAQVLVNAVNCVGVMGAGLALQFKLAFPIMFSSYVAACHRRGVAPGHLHVYALQDRRWIVNVATKRHWRDRSRLEDVEAGLLALVEFVDLHKIESLALPALGCGLGGLSWPIVKSMIEAAFSDMSQLNIELYMPL